MVKSSGLEKAVEEGGMKFNIVPARDARSSWSSPTTPLDSEEQNIITKIIENESQAGSRAQWSRDVAALQKLAAEIQSLSKQHLIFLGQRASEARTILKPYRDGSLSRWLEVAFGSKKSGYNVLAFYDLFMALPTQEIRDHFKKLPRKTGYILASRKGSLTKKIELIGWAQEKKQRQIVAQIQQILPREIDDRRSARFCPKKSVSVLLELCELIEAHKKKLSQDHKETIRECVRALNFSCR